MPTLREIAAQKFSAPDQNPEFHKKLKEILAMAPDEDHEMLELFASGQAAKDIAAKMGITEGRLRLHMIDVFRDYLKLPLGALNLQSFYKKLGLSAASDQIRFKRLRPDKEVLEALPSSYKSIVHLLIGGSDVEKIAAELLLTPASVEEKIRAICNRLYIEPTAEALIQRASPYFGPD